MSNAAPVRVTAVVWVAAVLAIVTLARPAPAEAGEMVTAYGTGKTYQTLYSSACQWYDYRIGSGAPCYQAVWSSTTAASPYTSDTVRVWSTAGYHDFSCYGGWCPYYYHTFTGDPVDVSSSYYVSDYLVHEHVPGSGQNPKNVVGHAWHMNVTRAPSGWWYTESYTYY